MKIDTLQISEDLKKAGVESKAAKELAHQFKLVREDVVSTEEAEAKLATKKDIEEIRLEIENVKLEIEKLRSDTNEKIEKLRSETAKSFQNQTMWLSGIMITSFIALASLIITLNK